LVQFNWGNYNEASKGYIQALGIYEKMGDKQGQLLCFQNLGNIYFSLGDYSLTIESQKKALKLSKQVNDRKGIAKAHQNLGETFFHLGDNKAAIKEFILSIKSKEALDDKEGTGITLASLGSLHFHQKDYAKAAYYYNKALEINKTIDLKAQMAQNYANLADVFSAKGLSDSAIAYYGKSQGINRELDNKSGLSDIALRLGSIYRIRKEYSKAKSYLLGALSSKKELGEKVSMASACTELAFLYLDMADGKKISENEAYNQAIVYGLKSYSIAEQVKEISAKISACDVLKHAYSAKGQTGNALRYDNEMMAARDSLFDKSKAEATIYAEAIWNTEKKQRQIENLENSRKISKGIIEKKELETKRQKILIFAISLILMVTIGLAIAIVLYIRKRRDMQYQKQLTNIAMLKMTNIRNRMSPHFFFNALSGIAGSVTEPELKSKFSNLSILLRKTVENIEQTVISLEEEMSTVKAFVELQHEHIPKPFEANFDIDTKVEIKHLLPAMIIQIPVENAIKHGLMLQTSESRKLNVNITAVDKGLHIEIKDNGIGLEASAGRTTGTGTGLKVLLQTIYLLNSKNHEKITFDIVDLYKQEPRENGTKVVIFIPGNYSYNL
jgi:tetratricopeptide (TPR) repeat protein